MKNAALKSISMNNKICLDSKFTNNLLDNVKKEYYQSNIESFIYFMLDIRLNISFIVSILNWFTAFFKVKHAEALNHIFYYLYDTLNINIIYITESKNSTFMFYSYTDADFVSTIVRENRCSTDDYVFMLNDEAIS